MRCNQRLNITYESSNKHLQKPKCKMKKKMFAKKNSYKGKPQ